MASTRFKHTSAYCSCAKICQSLIKFVLVFPEVITGIFVRDRIRNIPQGQGKIIPAMVRGRLKFNPVRLEHPQDRPHAVNGTSRPDAGHRGDFFWACGAFQDRRGDLFRQRQCASADELLGEKVGFPAERFDCGRIDFIDIDAREEFFASGHDRDRVFRTEVPAFGAGQALAVIHPRLFFDDGYGPGRTDGFTFFAPDAFFRIDTGHVFDNFHAGFLLSQLLNTTALATSTRLADAHSFILPCPGTGPPESFFRKRLEERVAENPVRFRCPVEAGDAPVEMGRVDEAGAESGFPDPFDHGGKGLAGESVDQFRPAGIGVYHPGRDPDIIVSGLLQQRKKLASDHGVSAGALLEFDLAADRPVGRFAFRVEVSRAVIPFDYREGAAGLQEDFQGPERFHGPGEMLQDEADEQVVERLRFERETENVGLPEGHIGQSGGFGFCPCFRDRGFGNVDRRDQRFRAVPGQGDGLRADAAAGFQHAASRRISGVGMEQVD